MTARDDVASRGSSERPRTATTSSTRESGPAVCVLTIRPGTSTVLPPTEASTWVGLISLGCAASIHRACGIDATAARNWPAST